MPKGDRPSYGKPQEAARLPKCYLEAWRDPLSDHEGGGLFTRDLDPISL
jgi:hypothetical protein